MELIPGIFLSSTATEEWVPDPGVPGTEVHVMVEADGVAAGMTRMVTAGDPFDWTPQQRETILILEGRVRIELDGGEELDLGAGDMASLRPGIATRWFVTVPFKEMWVIAGG